VQEIVQLAREHVAEAIDLGDLDGGGGAQPVDVAEMLQQRGTPDGAQPRKIVEDRLADFLRAQVGVVGVGETVCLVAQPL